MLELTPSTVTIEEVPAFVPDYVMTQAMQEAFEHFNRTLFEGQLPPAVITLQRKRNTRGYFLEDAFANRQANIVTAHEIAMNPDTFVGRTDTEILSTLVHEMVHHWHQEFGKPGKNGYHNQEWADKMIELGLQPESFDNPGGVTGRKVSHRIIDDGPFDHACSALLGEGYVLTWQSQPEMKKRSDPKKNKVKYVCPTCEAKAWGKPDLNIRCGDCDSSMDIA